MAESLSLAEGNHKHSVAVQALTDVGPRSTPERVVGRVGRHGDGKRPR